MNKDCRDTLCYVLMPWQRHQPSGPPPAYALKSFISGSSTHENEVTEVWFAASRENKSHPWHMHCMYSFPIVHLAQYHINIYCVSCIYFAMIDFVLESCFTRNKVHIILMLYDMVRGFVKLKKKIQKSEKNSEVGWWVKPHLGFDVFLGNFVFLCCFLLFSMFQKKMGREWVGGVWPIRVFLWFFQLDKTPLSMIEKNKISVEPPPPPRVRTFFVTLSLYAIVYTAYLEVSHGMAHQIYRKI